jgi:hypothetical protein
MSLLICIYIFHLCSIEVHRVLDEEWTKRQNIVKDSKDRFVEEFYSLIFF